MSNTDPDSKVLPSYRTPPVAEVVCGFRFERISQFKAPHSGLLWQKFRDEYPNCEHAAPIGLSPQSFDRASGLPLPRIWFLNEKGNHLIQIQNDRFHFNWRKMSDEEEYPRYEMVFSSFQKIFSVFSDFIDENELGPLRLVECELIYVNQIPQGEAWKSVDDIHKLFPDFTWRSTSKRFLPGPTDVSWKIIFSLPEEQGSLDVSLQQGSRKIDGLPALRLELRAHGLGKEQSVDGAWKWFPLAHKWIVNGFSDLTDMKIQKEVWGREG